MLNLWLPWALLMLHWVISLDNQKEELKKSGSFTSCVYLQTPMVTSLILGRRSTQRLAAQCQNDCLQKSRSSPFANVFIAGIWQLYKGVCQGALGHRWRRRMLPQHWLEQQQMFLRPAMSSGQPHKFRLQLTHLLAATGSYHAAGRNGGEKNGGWCWASHQRQWNTMPSFAYVKGYY